MEIYSSRFHYSVERVIPWLVLIILLFFTFVRFFTWPYAGFRYSSNGEIVQLFVKPDDINNSLLLGDQLVQIGTDLWSDFEANPREMLFDGVLADTSVPLTILREGELLSIPWLFPGPTTNEIVERLNSEWWLGFVFWVAGLATMLLVRPRDIRWLVMQAFVYLTAIWLTTGGFAETHVGSNLLVFKVAIWLAVPVYLHLHWIFPRKLARLPNIIWGLVYLAAGTLALGEWLLLIPGEFYLFGFLTALAGSLLLLLVRYIIRPSQRSGINLLVGGVLLSLAPPVGILLASSVNIKVPAFLAGGSLLALPAIPGAYFFTLYRQQLGPLERRANRLVRIYALSIGLGTGLILFLSVIIGQTDYFVTTPLSSLASLSVMVVLAVTSFAPFLSLVTLVSTYGLAPNTAAGTLRFRANQLLGPYLFIIVLGTVAVGLAILVEIQFNGPGSIFLTSITIAVICGGITIRAYAPFLRFVESRILSISLPPADLLEMYASRIPTRLERESLTQLLTNEILPSLLIRQSAIVRLENHPDGSDSLTVIYKRGIADEDLPDIAQLPQLLTQVNHYRADSVKNNLGLCDWARVIFPLFIGTELIGLWLLGQRDPDDLYSQQELETFRILADQTAVALANVFQSENLYLMYQANIERRENERTLLARELHDVFLHYLGVLRLQVDEDAVNSGFEETYQELKNLVRQTISGLRPAALNYGLPLAIEELIEALTLRTVRTQVKTKFKLTLQPNPKTRYSPEVEQHLFRLVQQASENALKHAQAQTIRIGGQLTPERIEIIVEDDGVGFATGSQHQELSILLSQKHFGLISMYERAKLIGATLRITSTPNHGTRVSVVWETGTLNRPDH